MIDYSEKLYLKAGTITTTHGIKGEVKVFPSVDDPGRFSIYKDVYLKGRKGLIPVEIENVKFFKKMVILKFKDIDDISDAALLRDYDVMAKREDIAELKENQFFDVDIIGLKVYDESGSLLGEVCEVLHSSANDVFVIKGEKGKEIMIPSVKEFIRSIDIEEGRIVASPLPGMLA